MNDDERRDPFASEAAWARDRIRFVIAQTRVMSSRLMGRTLGVEYDAEATELDDILRAGYKSVSKYWSVAMSEAIQASSFVHLIFGHLVGPDPVTHDVLKISLESALRQALRSGETWFIEDQKLPARGQDELNRLMVHPRRAAEWMLSMPMRRNLVPQSLARFIEGVQPVEKPDTKRMPKVKQDQLNSFCKGIEERNLTDEEVKMRAQAHFAGKHITALAMKAALQFYPGKRRRGDTKRTIEKYRPGG